MDDALPKLMKESATDRLVRAGVVTYIMALLLIAAFSLTLHVITDSIVQQQHLTARMVNLTGRQRMLTQRITRLLIERAAHAPFRSEHETEALLSEAMHKLDQEYASILTYRRSPAANPLNVAAVQAVYTDAPWRVDAQTAAFVAHARALEGRPQAELKLDDPDLVAIEAAMNAPLQDALNAAVYTIEQTSEANIAHLRNVLATLTGCMLVILLLEALLLYRPLFRRLRESTQELIHMGRTDPLTGCLNRRAFLQEASHLIRRVRAEGAPLSVMMLDLDRFKSVNDQYGHPAGDAVIHSVVATTLRQIRTADLLCRMGGEEFAVLLPGANCETATVAAERLRSAIEASIVTLDTQLNLALRVTVSVGLAVLRPDDDTVFPLLNRADRALYRAKEQGRNRVECDEPGDAQEDAPERSLAGFGQARLVLTEPAC